jgi:hypothetical protein
MHNGVSATLQQAKPKAGTISRLGREHRAQSAALRHGPQTGAKPRSQSRRRRIEPLILCNHASCRAARSTRRKSIGAGGLDEQACGPDRSEMTGHPSRAQTCEGRYEPQERRRTTRGKDQSFGQAAKARRLVAEHRAKRTRRCMISSERRISEAVALDVTGRCVARPVGCTDRSPHARSKTCPTLQARLAAASTRRAQTCETQSAPPHVELHRIVFARRKTARATALSDPSADARVAQRRENAEAGSSTAWPLWTAHRGPASVEGDKTSREAPDHYGAALRESVRRGSLELNSRGADGEVGPAMSGSPLVGGGQETCRLVRQAHGGDGEDVEAQGGNASMMPSRDERVRTSRRQPENKTDRPKPIGPAVPG